jgi:hypothetical protein
MTDPKFHLIINRSEEMNADWRLQPSIAGERKLNNMANVGIESKTLAFLHSTSNQLR